VYPTGLYIPPDFIYLQYLGAAYRFRLIPYEWAFLIIANSRGTITGHTDAAKTALHREKTLELLGVSHLGEDSAELLHTAGPMLPAEGPYQIFRAQHRFQLSDACGML